MEKNPQMIMWDPATYPDVETIADIGEAGILVRYFGGAAYMDYFTQTGHPLQPTRSTAATTARRRTSSPPRARTPSRASARPSRTSTRTRSPDWGKPVAYAYINDAGWENYAESIATKPENIETYRDCLAALVPIIQQSTVDFLADPDATNALIIEAVEAFDNGWVYTQGVADYAVETMQADGLIGNGPDDTVGNFDLDRVSV